MNRKLLIVLMLTAVLAAEGCRRGGGAKKAPIPVTNESDFLYTRKQDVLGAGLEPKRKMTPEQEAEEALKTKLKADSAGTKRKDDTIALGKFLLDYRKANPIPTSYSFEKIKVALRRQKLNDFYDTLDSDFLVQYLFNDLNPAHVIVYHKTGESTSDPAAKKTIEIGHPAVFADGRFEFVKGADLDKSLKSQELLVSWQYYMQFAMPNYYRASAEFPLYVPSAVTGTPPVFLGKIKARSPDLLKNPPDKFDLDRFKKYLNENAPPHLLGLIAGSKLSVSMNADLWKPAELVACRVASEGLDKDKKDRGHYGINAGMQVSLYDAEQIKPWIASNQSPKK